MHHVDGSIRLAEVHNILPLASIPLSRTFPSNGRKSIGEGLDGSITNLYMLRLNVSIKNFYLPNKRRGNLDIIAMCGRKQSR
jgi:hypothetical protein